MIIEILGIIAINILFQIAEPIILLKRFMGFKEEEYDKYSKLWRFIHRLLYCCACLGFWIALAISQSIYIAAICSIASEWIYTKIR
jgi:hypothetical protein